MILTEELQELKTMHKRMGELLARVESVAEVCRTCGHYKCGFCSEYQSDVPPDYAGPCDKWFFDDIPF